MGTVKRSRCLSQKSVKRDYLSELPDEIICKILSQSQLTVFDTYRISVLSRRWRKLWLLRYSIGPNLVFSRDYEPLLEYLHTSNWQGRPGPYSFVDRHRHMFTALLNKVFMSYEQPVVDEFVINFYLNSNFSGVIDEWISFAFSKGVKRFQLDLSPRFPFLKKFETPYAFPSTLPCGILPNLRDVCLKRMYIHQKSVDALLSACPLLEKFSLQPENPLNLKIAGQNLKLKHLEIHCSCSAYEERTEISAPNLISLSYTGNVSSLHLMDVPLLSEFRVHDTDQKPFLKTIDLHVSYLFQLKILKLFFCDEMVRKSMSYPLSFPDFAKLEQLELTLEGEPGHSFLWPTVLLKASPVLHRLSVVSFVSSMVDYPEMQKEIHSETDRRRIKEATKFSHQSLKVVEMRVFKGLRCEMELVQHLLDIGAQSLEKVLIDTRSRLVRKKEVEPAKKLARSLGKGLDSRVHFAVL